MIIEVNGEKKQLDQPQVLAEAITHWGYECALIAVAHNDEFVPRRRYTAIQLQDGDRLEIVAPMPGG